MAGCSGADMDQGPAPGVQTEDLEEGGHAEYLVDGHSDLPGNPFQTFPREVMVVMVDIQQDLEDRRGMGSPFGHYGFQQFQVLILKVIGS
jgi:hypothetical protein